jgi:hypothetical protein
LLFGINENGASPGSGLAKNAADVARVALPSTALDVEADVNVVATGGCLRAGIRAQCHVVVAGVAQQRIKTDNRVLVAIYVLTDRTHTNGRIVAAFRVTREGSATDGGVEPAGRVVKECRTTTQSCSTDCRVVVAGRIVKENLATNRSVEIGDVVKERKGADTRVVMREVSEKVPHLVEISLAASSACQTLARCDTRTSSQWFHKVARNPLFVVRDGTGRVGERCFLS